MELHTTNIQGAVAERHDLTFVAQSGDFQAVGQGLGIDHPRVISAHEDVLMQTLEDIVVLGDGLCGAQLGMTVLVEVAQVSGSLYAMEDVVQIDQLAAEALTDSLLA